MKLRDMVTDEERALVVSERKPITMPLLVLLALVSASVTGAVAYKDLKQSDEKHGGTESDLTKRIEDHEVRLRAIESATGRIDANLQQIREWMSEDRQRRAGTRP